MKKLYYIFAFVLITSIGYSYTSASFIYLNNLLNSTNRKLGKSQKRISKGMMLLTDSPANYAIYEKLESHIRGLDKMVGNSSDFYHYYQYQEGVMAVMVKSLQRIRELSVRLQSGILTDFDRSIIKNEMRSYYDHIVFQLKNSGFNRKKVFYAILDNKEWKKLFGQEKFYNIINIDLLLKFIIRQRSIVGAKMNGLRHQIKGKMIAKENLARAQSRYDTDFAKEITELKKNEIKMYAHVFMLHSKMNMEQNKARQLMR